jgi:hypothetical protein
LYVNHKGAICRAYTYHEPWKFRIGEVKIIENSLTESYNLGVKDLLKPELVHVSEGVEVLTWNIESTEEEGNE